MQQYGCAARYMIEDAAVDPEARWLDVRPAEAVIRNPAPLAAVWCPCDITMLATRAFDILPSTNKPVLVFCAQGGAQAKVAVDVLMAMGYKAALNVGGVSDLAKLMAVACHEDWDKYV